MAANKIKWLRLELTNACNFDCAYCTEQYMTRKKGFMDIKLAKKIIDEVALTKISDIIGFQFMGEGLLHPKFNEIISYAKENNVKCKLVTNGSLLTDDNIHNIINSSVQEVYISYFTSDDHSFKIRHAKGIDYTEYQKRVRNMIRKKIESKASTRISIGLLNTKYSFLPGLDGMDNTKKIRDDVVSLIHFIKDIEKRSGVASSVQDITEIERHEDLLENYTYVITSDISVVFIEVGTWANQFLIKNGVKITKSTKGHCLNPFEQLFVAWDGTCTCCCLDYDCSMVVGNVNQNSIADIWNGDRYKTIRDAMKRKELVEEYCQTCRGKIDLFSFLRKANVKKLSRMLLNRQKLKYLINRGWKRFNFIQNEKTS